MKTKDTRHYSPTREEDEAKQLLDELARIWKYGHWVRPCRSDCRNTDHPHGEPGFVIKKLPKHKRDILKKLKSDREM